MPTDDYPPNWEELQAQIRADVGQAITALLSAVATLNQIASRTDAEINANPATAIKLVAAQLKIVVRQLGRLTRMSTSSFDTGDVGT
jgi:hypothetical protein